MIKLPTIHIGRLSLLLSILVWLALLFVDLVRLFGVINNLNSGIVPEFTWVLEILFFLTVYSFYNYNLQKNAQNEFLNLLWRAASTGIFASAAFLVIQIFYEFLGDSKLGQEPFLRNFFYHVHFALISIFLVSTTLLWKKLILYQKTKQVVQQWKTYEIGLLIAMFFVFFSQDTFGYSFIFGFVILTVLGGFLSVNLKWIPYLTFKEKWKSLLFLAIIIVCSVYLFLQTNAYSSAQQTYPINLLDNLFLISLYVFILIYALFSFLVTLFNLPTSSVFEQKLTEAINFQRLSQSIQPDEDEEKVLDILMDSCMSASFADGAWLEMYQTDRNQTIIQTRWIEEKEKEELSQLIESNSVAQNWAKESKADLLNPLALKISHPKFGSLLLVPLVINKSVIGRMVLCKELKDGFNKEMVSIIETFARQASISVENHRLLNQAIQNERYQEELKIAQRVQKALLPNNLEHNQSFEICAYSNAADEVGGDYYDTFQLDQHRYALIIGDVSGKGTSAAFHMAQMKGVFQSLIQLNLSPKEFLIRSNAALSRCLERNHFITASIFIIDTLNHQVCHARAGHVPTLFYRSGNQNAEYLGIGGLGLGILRNMQYEKHVEEKEFTYHSGDILVLFTDGIVEAKNQKSQQFGFERIRALVEINHHLSPKEIQTKLIDTLHDFVGGDGLIDDDYSLLVVKFN
ncbi:SpoIIE family protein phosphatase [Algoriphagus limi]|uniref:SpoIIE family protein phosphatase n=1 Tax=Algoriphagus limi TaxID=2975273 RepID=A0ABT2G9P3_9BACT|nr:SpoIIE family protein phosphatase [Algoriphagus limi]MCS5490657.1 SpoIIE family protein phosphatase [Algoriphagus limi]